jgi:hypothetical protein
MHWNNIGFCRFLNDRLQLQPFSQSYDMLGLDQILLKDVEMALEEMTAGVYWGGEHIPSHSAIVHAPIST